MGTVLYSDEDKARMIEMYTQGYMPLEIANEFACSLHTVTRALDGVDKRDHRGYITPKGRIAPEDKQEMIRLYQAGEKVEVIAKQFNKYPSSVINVLTRAGVYIKTKEKSFDDKIPYATNSLILRNRLNEAILTADIEEIRSRFKVGDKITVKTCKFGDLEYAQSHTIRRRATVIDVSHPRFVQVKLNANGVTEAFLWSDLVMAERKKAEAST